MDFVILKVNGKDVSNSSHEDAVRCFESAQEPIIVEVLRRQPGQQQTPKEQLVERTTSLHQDAFAEKGDDDADKETTATATSPLVSTAVQTDWAGLIEEELIPGPLNIEEQPNDSFEDFLPHDIDFEEVTLRKSGSAEKLGLTVCYSSGSGSEDADTEVYISEIVPESLAARDGRLREGDQILRVNGKDVANKEQTECLFAATKNAVTILVSRCLYQDEEYDDRQIYNQESPSISPDNNPAYQNSMIEQLIRQQKESEESTKECETKISSASTKVTITSSPPPIPCHNPQQGSQPEDRKQWMQDASKECSRKMDALNLRPQQPGPPSLVRLVDAYTSHVWSDTEHIYETIPESDGEPIYSSPYEHRQWAQSHQQQHQANNRSQTTKAWNSSSKSNSSGEEKESSSAYNTGESCNSNPLTLELHQAEKEHHKSTLVLCPPSKIPTQSKSSASIANSNSAPTATTGCSCPHANTQISSSKQPRTQPGRKSHQQSSRDHRDVVNASSTLPADTMYTNAANLQQTILLQQELFKQALMTRRSATQTRGEPGARKSKSHGNFQAPNLTRYQFVGSQQVCASSWVPPEDKCEVQMEWKVKRRPDGTRYIARRPVRNRILKNRAIKISEERAGQTTEDDTMSEMKVGRYWSKEERKRQLERARERKRQQEMQQQQQQQQQQQLLQQQLPQLYANDMTIGDCSDEKLLKKPINIVELSHKKMARKKTTIDDFTTVQEMLVHGNRVGGGGGGGGGPGAGGKLMGLLSVTTV